MEFMDRFHSRDQQLCDQRNCLQEKNTTPTGLVWGTNMDNILLFRDTSMADVKSCEKALYDSAREFIFHWCHVDNEFLKKIKPITCMIN